MRICPECSTRYTDDSLLYCLQDGAQLSEVADDAATFETSDDGPETILSQKRPDKIEFDLSQPETREEKSSHQISEAPAEPAPRSSKTLLAVVLTALAMLAIFGGVLAGFWYYINQPKNNLVKNSEPRKTESPVSSGSNENRTTPSPTKQPKPTPTMTPAEVDKDKATKEVAMQLSSWKTFAEARNLPAYMNKYALWVDYYNKRRASRTFVMKDKQKAFTNYTSIKSKFTDIKITPSGDGKTATAVFDKEWDFSGPEKSTTGKVRTRLVFRKTGDKWLIVSEKDLKVYYVNK